MKHLSKHSTLQAILEENYGTANKSVVICDCSYQHSAALERGEEVNYSHLTKSLVMAIHFASSCCR